ncbi:hypothetical protein GF340_01760 [Candidatus Peregrinibacteria bacterium]|nr:hypothetical protein [Candidatus Peregrinibacteria bacterium]
MEFKYVKIVVYVPVEFAESIRNALAKAGAGKMGNYSECSFSMRGTGRFTPLEGSNPFIGNQNKIEEVIEERIETVCPAEIYKQVIVDVTKAHPYEEPAIDVYPLINM